MGERGRCAVDHIAAAAAAFTVASIPETVPCGAHLRQWVSLEQGFETADVSEKRTTLSIVAEICRSCTALEECAAWATEDKYTGFAAGTWHFSGRRTRPAQVDALG